MSTANWPSASASTSRLACGEVHWRQPQLRSGTSQGSIQRRGSRANSSPTHQMCRPTGGRRAITSQSIGVRCTPPSGAEGRPPRDRLPRNRRRQHGHTPTPVQETPPGPQPMPPIVLQRGKRHSSAVGQASPNSGTKRQIARHPSTRVNPLCVGGAAQAGVARATYASG